MNQDPQLQARQVDARIKIGEVDVPVSSLTMQHSVNDLPTISFTTQLGNQPVPGNLFGQFGSVNLDLAGFGELNKAVQQKILNGFTLDPNVGLVVTDGYNQTVQFKGFLGQPSFQMLSGNMKLAFTAVHPGARLQAFNGQIYVSDEYWAQDMLKNMFLDAYFTEQLFDPDLVFLKTPEQLGSILTEKTKLAKQAPHKTDSIAQRMRIIVRALHDHFVSDSNAITRVDNFLPVFNLNDMLMKYVSQVLLTSEPFTMIGGLSDDAFDDGPMLQGLYGLLINSPNFYATLGGMRQMFMMQLNADWNGALWLEHLFTNQPTEGRHIKVPVNDVAFSLAHQFEPPVRQVLIQSPSSGYWALQGSLGRINNQEVTVPTGVDFVNVAAQAVASGDTSLRAVAAYPPTLDPNVAGTFYTMLAPEWTWPSERQLEEAYNIEARDNTKYDRWGSCMTRLKHMQINWREFGQARQHVLDYMAEATYRDLHLSHTTANVSTDMNLAVKAGRTYDVYSTDNVLLFSGYLHTVLHHLEINTEGGVGTAVTSMSFSHVRAPHAYISAIDNPGGLIKPPSLYPEWLKNIPDASSQIQLYPDWLGDVVGYSTSDAYKP